MAIPTQQDQSLAEISDLAACIQAKLSIMRHAGKNGCRDYAGLRNQLQEFVNKAMAFARATEP
jgi:hypothetical protein